MVISQTILPENTGIYRSAHTLSTINISDASSFSVYPNPSTGFLHLYGKHPIAGVQMSDIVSTKVDNRIDKDLNLIDISSVAAGVYVLRINDIYGN